MAKSRPFFDATIDVDGRAVSLSNLGKIFWPKERITKGDLVRYYVDVAPALLPHLKGRAMVMKRYPNGVSGDFFFMKRAPTPRPDWIKTCAIKHASGNVIHFPVIDDLASLLWVINLGCIDLNPWYARCDDVHRPDYLHFDLDPVNAPFGRVREAALVLHETLRALKMPAYAKTSGKRGVHVYVPIVRGPTQKQVWTVAKAIAVDVASRHKRLLTAEYAVEKRPLDRVLVDFNQNAWGRTLASVYSVRPCPGATVSAPVTWEELADCEISDYRLDNMLRRIEEEGDLWAPLAPEAKHRYKLERLLGEAAA